MAKAGLQKAINYFNSDKYKAVAPNDATATYQVSPYSTTPLTLYATIARPVTCIANCPQINRPILLQMDSSGAFNGNYPTTLEVTETDASPVTVSTAFTNRFFDVSLNPLSNAANSGQFTMSATLLEYYTVNDAFYPTVNRKAYEVWFVESNATWNSNAGAGAAKPTSVQQATLAPVYLPYFANALYGMCNITMNGSVCTDSYNSTSGAYNGSDAADCVSSGSTGSNALPSGAGIGSGGNVALNGGSYTVNGDVSYGASPPTYSAPWACATGTSGVTGTVTGVTGSVQPVPAIPQPPMPTFPDCDWYGGSGNCSSGSMPPNPTNLGNGEQAWVVNDSGNWVFRTLTSGAHGTTITTNFPLTGAAGSGTQTDPFRLPAIDVGNNNNNVLCLAGSSDPANPMHYDLRNLTQGNGKIYIVDGSNPPSACDSTTLASYTGFGNVVLNIYQTLSIGAQGVTNSGAPASSLLINVYNSGSNSGTSVTINGQGNMTAVITALGDATLGGGGTGGAFYGSILAGSVTDGGSYAVHYDRSLQVLSGKLMPMAIRNYNRPKI